VKSIFKEYKGDKGEGAGLEDSKRMFRKLGSWTSEEKVMKIIAPSPRHRHNSTCRVKSDLLQYDQRSPVDLGLVTQKKLVIVTFTSHPEYLSHMYTALLDDVETYDGQLRPKLSTSCDYQRQNRDLRSPSPILELFSDHFVRVCQMKPVRTIEASSIMASSLIAGYSAVSDPCLLVCVIPAHLTVVILNVFVR
jgi:hypothetical protein